ncbi:MAG: hypothetical protein GQ564_20965 [Bacteroidales bacterium]|nr:hypothetical protein [Bacteroidales bacterium]
MKRKILFSVALSFVSFAIFAQTNQTEPTTSTGGGIDWFELIAIIGYLGGVFILLPIVIYTNLKEKLFIQSDDTPSEILNNLSQTERNNRSSIILEEIGKKLSPYKDENGIDLITITNGSQARFMKHGLDYINKNLCPDDPEILERVSEFTIVYNDRTRRAFTGSNWIIFCGIGIGALMLFTGGISTFIFIHALGLLFYILSSRTTFYGIEKRMNYFSGSGMISSVMTGLFLGNGVKHYVKEGGGSWKRDWETEGQMAIIGLLFMFVIAMFLGFLAAFLGVINFIFNYSRSFTLPFKSNNDWYESKFN